MPIYEIEKGGKVFEVEAPDMNAAVAAIGSNPAISTPPPAAATVGMMPNSTVGSDAGKPHTALDVARDMAQQDMNRTNTSAAKLRQEALEHPYRTAAMIAIPGVVGKGVQLAKPLVGPTVRAGLTKLEDPIVGGASGAILGGMIGGP